jgi:uncharacterized protein (DUF433 family)
MPAVRHALGELNKLSIPLWKDDRPSVVVDSRGRVHLQTPSGVQALSGQLIAPDTLDLIAPFRTLEGCMGPDLLRPRPLLRIVPGKLSGSPHVDHTRLETRALAALAADGLSPAAIRDLYPYLAERQIAEAIDLEEQLARNLSIVSAA